MKKLSHWKSFLELCRSCKDIEELDQWFQLFFTFEERERFASRYIILQKLMEGHLPQRELSKEYHVSIAQITRGSNALKALSPKNKKKMYSYFKLKDPL